MAEEVRAQQAQMGMAGGGQIGFDCSKAYAASREGLQVTKHSWNVEEAEKRLLGDRYPRSKSATEVFLAGKGGGERRGSGEGVRRRSRGSKVE